jgi:hypothetical protein
MYTAEAGGTYVSPAFPDFVEIPVPSDVFLTKRTCAGPVRSRVRPARAYRGRIQPFASEGVAASAARLLNGSFGVDVHGGFLLSDERSNSLPAIELNPTRQDLTQDFEVLVLGFDHTPDFWAFSLNPAISFQTFKDHPHLRGDRELVLNGRILHGLCVYSAAEFSISHFPSPLAEFLRQVSIYLAKHLIWLTILPKKWVGNVALSGAAHLSLDPNGPCWCGDGKIYKHCCLPAEVLQALRRVKGLNVPTDLVIQAK